MKKSMAMMAAGVMAAFMMTGCGSSSSTATTAAPAETAAPSSAEAAETSTEQAAEASDADSDLAYVQGKGTLVVGITDFEPMDYKDASGEWIGFDADMAKAFAESIGVDVDFVEIDWDNKILELNGKTIDCV
jgi:polar amino acid transport system substrate-binding protein